MKILRWCGRHKFWATIIILVIGTQLVCLVFPDNTFVIGRWVGNIVGVMLVFWVIRYVWLRLMKQGSKE